MDTVYLRVPKSMFFGAKSAKKSQNSQKNLCRRLWEQDADSSSSATKSDESGDILISILLKLISILLKTRMFWPKKQNTSKVEE